MGQLKIVREEVPIVDDTLILNSLNYWQTRCEELGRKAERYREGIIKELKTNCKCREGLCNLHNALFKGDMIK